MISAGKEILIKPLESLQACDSTTIVNSVFFDNNKPSSGAGVLTLYGGSIDFINTTVVNNKGYNIISKNHGNSKICLYNSVVWNDSIFSLSNTHLIDSLDSSDNDFIGATILDSSKVGVIKLSINSWDRYNEGIPVFKSLNNPGGINNEKWYTLECGLIYNSFSSPGYKEGWFEYDACDYNLIKWDIRGEGFSRIPLGANLDCGAYELNPW